MGLNAFSKVAKKSKTASSKKSSTNVVDASEIRDALKKFIQAKSDENDAKAKKVEAEKEIIELGYKKRKVICRNEGKEVSSVMLDGGKLDGKQQEDGNHPKVRFTVKNNWKVREADAVREAFDENYDKYFIEKTEASLTDAAINDTKVLAKLIKICGTKLTISIEPTVLQDDDLAEKIVTAIGGEDNLSQYFDISQTAKATERFHSDCVLNDDIEAIVAPLIKREAITNDKPTLKEN